MTESGKPRMTCGKAGQQKLVVWDNRVKSEDNRKAEMHSLKKKKEREREKRN
jgi:hypothetical protein